MSVSEKLDLGDLEGFFSTYSLSNVILVRNEFTELIICKSLETNEQYLLKVMSKLEAPELGAKLFPSSLKKQVDNWFEDDSFMYQVQKLLPHGDLFQMLENRVELCEGDVRDVAFDLSGMTDLLPQQWLPDMTPEDLVLKSPHDPELTPNKSVEKMDEPWLYINSNYEVHPAGRKLTKSIPSKFVLNRALKCLTLSEEIESLEIQVGELSFLSPEAINGRKVNSKSMAWRIGIMVYILLSGGHHPFAADTKEELFDNIENKELEFPESQGWDKISDAAKQFLELALDKDPDTRADDNDLFDDFWCNDDHHYRDHVLAMDELAAYNTKRKTLRQLKSRYYLDKFGSLLQDKLNGEEFSFFVLANIIPKYAEKQRAHVSKYLRYRQQPRTTLPLPCKSLERGRGVLEGETELLYFHAQCQGGRVESEDCLIFEPNITDELPDAHMWGVFDGHGGYEVAAFAKEKVLSVFLEVLEAEGFDSGDFEQSLKDTFIRLDEMIISEEDYQAELGLKRATGLCFQFLSLRQIAVHELGDIFLLEQFERLFDHFTKYNLKIPEIDDKLQDCMDRIQSKDLEVSNYAKFYPPDESAALELAEALYIDEDIAKITAGSTANCVLMYEGVLYCANIGDSKSFICREEETIVLSEDHKPVVESELERITEAGGIVEDGRINQVLNLSRALGDSDFKEQDLPREEQVVIADADVVAHQIEDDDLFVVTATDGVLQHMSPEDICTTILECVKGGDDPQDAISEIIQSTLKSKDVAADNMSIILVLLKPLEYFT